MTETARPSRWVRVNTTTRQEYICGPCAGIARRMGEEIVYQTTLRVAAETACCCKCRRYGTFPVAGAQHPKN